MTEASILAQLFQAGPFGIIIGYLMWDRGQERARQEKADTIRAVYDNARLETDRAIAAAMSALTTIIQSDRRS